MLTGLTALLLGLCGCAVPPETTSAPSGVQAPVAPANVPDKPDAAADAGGAPVTLNLADFGAAGNGQADDTAALRNAVSAVLEAGGGTVYLPAGTYRLTDTLMLTGDDSAPLTLRADPTGQTVLVADASVNGPAVWIERSGVTLFGLDIILGTTEDQPAVLVTGSHVTLDSVTARMTAGNTAFWCTAPMIRSGTAVSGMCPTRSIWWCSARCRDWMRSAMCWRIVTSVAWQASACWSRARTTTAYRSN